MQGRFWASLGPSVMSYGLKFCKWYDFKGCNDMHNISIIFWFGDLRPDKCHDLFTETLLVNLTTQINPDIMTQLRYSFQDNHISNHSRLEDHKLWLPTSSMSSQATCQHLGARRSIRRPFLAAISDWNSGIMHDVVASNKKYKLDPTGVEFEHCTLTWPEVKFWHCHL